MGFVNKSQGTVSGVEGDTNKYVVANLQYPIDLDISEEYGGHKVVFFINVPANSAVATGKVYSQMFDEGVDNVQFGTGTTDLPPNKYMSKSGDKIKEAANVAPVRAGIEALGIKASVLEKYKRLTSAISLYMPNELTTGYSVNWDTEDMSSLAIYDQFAGAANKAGASMGLSKSAGDNAAAVGGGIADAAKIAMGSVANKAFQSGRMRFAEKALGVTYGNSKSEQLFKSVDFRTFQFNFQFSPKSEAEGKNVLNIVRMFRYHMLPEYLRADNFLYIYPSEFDIKYYRQDKENEYLEKQMTAVLTNFTVNYTPNGQFVTFDNGMPTQINVAMTFKELALPTKETSPFYKSGI